MMVIVLLWNEKRSEPVAYSMLHYYSHSEKRPLTVQWQLAKEIM